NSTGEGIVVARPLATSLVEPYEDGRVVEQGCHISAGFFGHFGIAGVQGDDIGRHEGVGDAEVTEEPGATIPELAPAAVHDGVEAGDLPLQAGVGLARQERFTGQRPLLVEMAEVGVQLGADRAGGGTLLDVAGPASLLEESLRNVLTDGKRIPYLHVIVDQHRHLQRGRVEAQLLNGVAAEQVNADFMEPDAVFQHQEPGHQGAVGTAAVTADQVQIVHGTPPYTCVAWVTFGAIPAPSYSSDGEGGGHSPDQ